MTDTPRHVIRVLKKIGFVQVRVTGSHRILKRGTTIIPVPYHTGDLNPRAFHRILKQASLISMNTLRCASLKIPVFGIRTAP